MGIEIRTDRREDAFAIRRRVFMEEQGYEDEFDAIDDDPRCLHMTLSVDGDPVGCSRVFPEPLERVLAPSSPQSPACALDDGIDADAVYLLGRVAVLPGFRHRGLAARIICESERAARAAGARLIKLHAQERVQPMRTRVSPTSGWQRFCNRFPAQPYFMIAGMSRVRSSFCFVSNPFARMRLRLPSARNRSSVN